jgi:hypothetical protein
VHVACLHGTAKHFQFKESLISRRYFLSLFILQEELILSYYVRILRNKVDYSFCETYSVKVLHGKGELITLPLFLQID